MIYVSTSCVKNELIKDSVRELAEMGFNRVELSGGTGHYEGYLDDLLELKSEYGLDYTVHNYFPPPKEDFVLNLTASDEKVYALSKGLISEAVAISGSLGASIYAFHPGYCVDLRPEKKGIYFDYSRDEEFDKLEYEKLFFERFDDLLDSLPKDHIRIGVENLFPFNAEEDYSLLSHPDEIMRFLNYYSDNSRVGLLLDFGHLSVSSNYFNFDKLQFIEQLFMEFPHKIFEIHLSENDGIGDYHNGPGDDSWQISIINRNIELARSIPVTVEWKDVRHHLAKLRDLEKMTGALS